MLLRQPYIRDESLNMAQLLDSVASQIRENIVVKRFVRWEIVPEEYPIEGSRTTLEPFFRRMHFNLTTRMNWFIYPFNLNVLISFLKSKI